MDENFDIKEMADKFPDAGPSTQHANVHKDIHQLGHVHELRQDFSIWSLGSLCLALMATWEALASVVAAALANGGAPCLFYNYIISFIGTVAIACSLAEMASIYPTAGGQYHWVAALAPRNQMLVASWFTGWISIGGQIVLTASAAFAAGLQFQGLVVLNYPDSYTPQRYQGTMFYWLVLIYSAIVNIWGSRVLPHTNLAAAVIHVVGFAAIMIVLGVMAPKHDSSFVFVEVTNTSGWSNDGISWLVGLLSTAYPFLGYDASCHLAEELPKPSRNIPIAMVGSVVINGILGLGFCLMLLYSLGNLNDLLASPTGFPFMQLFLNATGSKAGATVLTLILSLTAVAANAAGCTSTSRTYWSFARDEATPFPRFFSRVDPRLQVPVRAVVALTGVQVLLGFIYLGNTTAFNAILSMAVLGMYASYLLPIVYMFIHGRRKLKPSEYGPFRLGSIFGPIINVIAIFWLSIAMIFSMFPSIQPVTAVNMNYSIVVMGGWLFFGVAFYAGWGRHRYNGPVV
ncbi:amino acid transporter-like protein [Coleophoma cylindrospora]|uniref:Amino acid transporter-like protein n=1 Tax=Coleophoma cylindrospora TaxID=1849047 RepID=A0A3D8RGR1_9HELO|nr:amino acid transporter-like protein [Coleophoma cylindrospora]